MTSDQAYRRVVIPLGLFFGLGGTVSFVMFAFSLVPITGPFPFVRSMELNRLIFCVIAIGCVAIGIGLLFRQRAAWYGFFAYIAVGEMLRWSSLFDPEVWSIGGLNEHQRFIGVVLSSLIDLALVSVVYHFGNPAFARNQPQP